MFVLQVDGKVSASFGRNSTTAVLKVDSWLRILENGRRQFPRAVIFLIAAKVQLYGLVVRYLKLHRVSSRPKR